MKPKTRKQRRKERLRKLEELKKATEKGEKVKRKLATWSFIEKKCKPSRPEVFSTLGI